VETRARQHGQWRAMETGHPSTRAVITRVNSGSGNRALIFFVRRILQQRCIRKSEKYPAAL